MATFYAYKNFNNYYNRKLKKYDNINDYPEPDYIETGTYFNFNPNDNIDTTQVLGRPSVYDYNGDCDYLIYSEDNINITSRWYIIEQVRKLKGQYTLELHRDVLADNWDKILNSDCFIEKAILPDNNNLIFNQEGVTVNQIKKGETLLKDETGVAWLVGYLASNYAGGNLSFDAQVVSDYSGTSVNDLIAALDDLEPNTTYRYNTTNNDLVFRGSKDFTGWGQYHDFEIKLNQSPLGWSYSVGNETYYTPNYNWVLRQSDKMDDVIATFEAFFDTTYFTAHISDLTPAGVRNTFVTTQKLSVIYGASNKIFTDTDGADAGDYKINVTTGSTTSSWYINSGDLLTYINNFIASEAIGTGTVEGFTFSRNNYATAKYNLTPIALGEYTIQMPTAVNRLHLKDAPYDMFCIPYGDIELVNSKVVGFTDVVVDKSLALSIAQGMARELSSNLIDLQIVPYCPMTGFDTSTEGVLDINNASAKRYTAVKNSSNNNVCYVLWSTASNGSKNIEYTIDIDNVKVSNQCDVYRLVSPNYNGQFEFNAAMNDGVTVFNIDFSYIPYQPYIHINPVFSRMYGDNYNDARGLICGGDFSVSYNSNKWQDYKVQNKNYQNIFDREIQNMEVNHKYDMIQSRISAGLGALGAGATSGIVTGNVGVGLVGGLFSAAAGYGDLRIKEKLYSEAVDYKTDMFNMQLDNIKSLPYSLAKCSTINQNNKVFPFIEYYTCSDEEKEAFAKKVAWNSMTVGVIGNPIEYIGNSWSYNGITDKGYIKARLIRLEDSNDDFHNVNAIADELFKGVYTK